MRGTITVCVRCLSRFIINLKGCLCKIIIFWIFLYHLKGVCCFQEKKKSNSDLSAVPPLCRLLWDFIIFTIQNWTRKVLLLTTSLRVFPVALIWNLSKDLTFLWRCSSYILFTGSYFLIIFMSLKQCFWILLCSVLIWFVWGFWFVCLFLIPGDFFRACSNCDLAFV